MKSPFRCTSLQADSYKCTEAADRPSSLNMKRQGACNLDPNPPSSGPHIREPTGAVRRPTEVSRIYPEDDPPVHRLIISFARRGLSFVPAPEILLIFLHVTGDSILDTIPNRDTDCVPHNRSILSVSGLKAKGRGVKVKSQVLHARQ